MRDDKSLPKPDAKSRTKERLLKLLRDGRFALGLACLIFAALAHVISKTSEVQQVHYLVFVLELIAILSAEFGAVLLSIRFLQLMYEEHLRVEYLADIASSVRRVIKEEFEDTGNAELYIEKVKRIVIESSKRDLESCWSFQRFGMKSVHENLSTGEVGDRLAKAKSIQVMKTWFPDHQDIELGFKTAMSTPGVRVRLLLSHPDSRLLEGRSIGAAQSSDHGLRHVEQTLVSVYNWTKENAEHSFEIGLYKGWPGCPIIWHGEPKRENVLLGFYLRSKSSPFWPWIEIEAGSDFDRILRKQFEDLFDDLRKKKHSIISNRKELGKWLDKRGLLKRSDDHFT